MAHEPTTDRGRRSRDRIVEAADALIDDQGVRGAGVDRIIARARVSKSQLYHFFSGKDDLVRAVIADRFERVLDAQMSMLTDLGSWAGIRRWLDMFVTENQVHDLPGCPIGTLAGELAARDEAARADLAGCFSTWEQYLVKGLESMRARGQLVPDADPEQLATVVFAGLQGGLLLAKTHKNIEPLRIALDAAFAHLRSFRAQTEDPQEHT
ncbi:MULTISPECIES: TetR/AcrR family transcriptional regulator [Actinomadura]|uniref:TetR family transcriptional regulator n=1 Tax=Actinomadura litoris TaxID=2678616 RepID=A0A7K1L2B9_9ACTN|nr:MULTISPECIES: TetR/AcrR family transcriptional regulator [Actinomadura]MBT2208856.1 TetR/AcrR family transcriptional regulator [Actinomadura sp. NEAU-AAG7]MUN38584.1 TetR family transcriptional regulator [Actinomadura litoris]